MDREMLHRIKKAGEYQKKAIMALLPEQMERHLDVIEKEIRMMAAETVAGMVWECKKKDAAWKWQDHKGTNQGSQTDLGAQTNRGMGGHEKTSARKVDIE